MLGHTRGDTGIYRYNFDEKLLLPVKRHRGEPGHTRDTRNTRTHKGTQYPVPVGSGRTARVVDGGVTATGVLSRQRGNLITIGNTQ